MAGDDPTALGHIVLALLTVLLLVVAAAAVGFVEKTIKQGLRSAKNSAGPARPAYEHPPTARQNNHE